MNNVELWLTLNRIHGDLSPHNVLYWQGGPHVIDFPQATDPRFNRNARDLLHRDIDNLCRYFAPFGVEVSADALTDDLWRRFLRAEL
jgi:RIO kinase 1